mmetsp:Transcript_36337/g.67690  ORF Transcript_36337/g.67690 Transcript_36337/m.67690 type:complete len:238 (+) Transcript_36337:87-800(+)
MNFRSSLELVETRRRHQTSSLLTTVLRDIRHTLLLVCHTKQRLLLARVVEIRASEASFVGAGLVKDVDHTALLMGAAKPHLLTSIHRETGVLAATSLLTLGFCTRQMQIDHTFFLMRRAKPSFLLSFIIKERKDVTSFDLTGVNNCPKVDHALLLVGPTEATALFTSEIKQANLLTALTNGCTNVTSHHSFLSMVLTELTTFVRGECIDGILIAIVILALVACVLEPIHINHPIFFV